MQVLAVNAIQQAATMDFISLRLSRTTTMSARHNVTAATKGMLHRSRRFPAKRKYFRRPRNEWASDPLPYSFFTDGFEK